MTGSSASAIPPGNLYLIPTPLDSGVAGTLPEATLAVVRGLRHFVAETPKHARHFLQEVGLPVPIQQVVIARLDHNVPIARVPDLLEPLVLGSDVGILSDAGCPGIADPGAELVRLAHLRTINVIPLVGPCAIILALMAAGMNGQRFAFSGYLPTGQDERAAQLRELERESRERDLTQIFIETPYRNPHMLEAILRHCASDTRVCVATALTAPDASIVSRTVDQWRRSGVTATKRPAVFLLYSR